MKKRPLSILPQFTSICLQFASICLQPTRNAQSRGVCHQHFMQHFATFEENAFAIFGRNRLQIIGVMYAQFAPVGGYPIGIQIHNHRIRPTFVVAKLVKVFSVKTTRFVQRVVKFVARNTRVTRCVEVGDEVVHKFKKLAFVHVLMSAVEPINLIISNQFVVILDRIVADTCRKELFV